MSDLQCFLSDARKNLTLQNLKKSDEPPTQTPTTGLRYNRCSVRWINIGIVFRQADGSPDLTAPAFP